MTFVNQSLNDSESRNLVETELVDCYSKSAVTTSFVISFNFWIITSGKRHRFLLILIPQRRYVNRLLMRFIKLATCAGKYVISALFWAKVHAKYDQAIDLIRGLLKVTNMMLFTCSSATEANYWWIYSMLENVAGFRV